MEVFAIWNFRWSNRANIFFVPKCILLDFCRLLLKDAFRGKLWKLQTSNIWERKSKQRVMILIMDLQQTFDLPKEDVDESQHSTNQRRPANDKKYSTRTTTHKRTKTIKLIAEYLCS